MVDTIFTFCVAVSLVSGRVATEALPLPITKKKNTFTWRPVQQLETYPFWIFSGRLESYESCDTQSTKIEEYQLNALRTSSTTIGHYGWQKSQLSPTQNHT